MESDIHTHSMIIMIYSIASYLHVQKHIHLEHQLKLHYFTYHISFEFCICNLTLKYQNSLWVLILSFTRLSVLYNLITRLRQPCYHLAGWKQSSHNLVTTMCMVNNIITTLSSPCSLYTTLLQPCHNLVTSLYNLVISIWVAMKEE